jgi:alkanesulfonate monooxygenase SsuD/methylene tetrahydromethanopterin reductase-like flavin-dependent oxidoreductase (luciferase family)
MTLSFGVMLLQDRPLDEVLDSAQRFDAAGVDSLWVGDLSNPYALDLPWLDPWLVLAAMATRTGQ